MAGSSVTLSTRTVARVAAALWVGCGGLVASAAPLVAADGANRLLMVTVGALAVGVGAVVWFLPWDRWGNRSTLLLIPLAFSFIAVFNSSSSDPWSYDVFFLVSFAWIGLAHPPWTSLASAPAFVVAYLAPFAGWDDSTQGVRSLVYVLPTTVLLGEAVSFVSSRLRRAELDRALSEARYSALVRSAAEYAVILDDEGTVVFASDAVRRVLGVDPVAVVGTIGGALVHPADMPLVNEHFREVRAGGGERPPVLFRALHADGGVRWIEGTVANLRDDPSVGGIVVNGRDVTERVEAEDRLAHLARHDPLTSLPNRAALLDELGRAMARAARRDSLVAVLFIDLDGFKLVNDTLGHAVGDDVLTAAAARIRSVLRGGDMLARLAGDEFTVVVEGVDDSAEPIALADRLVSAMRLPLEIGDRRHVITASIGISVTVAGDHDPDELLRQADLAMYRAKELGRGRYEVYDHGLARRARRRLDVEEELRAALVNNELELHFQPEVDIAFDRVAGMEALVRWQHPTRGVLLPSEFLDVAEQSDLILDVGRFVLDRACATAADWAAHYGNRAPEMSVNVSARQLHDGGFVADVHSALRRHGLAPDRLRLEITERVLLDSILPEALGELKATGVGLAVDDFGTGHSSLSSLERLPIDVVKIDRSFLAPVLSPDDRAPLLDAALALARSLGLRAVAQGVETPAQTALLLELGCHAAQGFFFGRPAPAPAAERFLLERSGGVDQPRLATPGREQLDPDR